MKSDSNFLRSDGLVRRVISSSPTYLINKVRRKFARERLSPPNRRVQVLIDALRARISSLPEIDPGEAKGSTQQLWLENRIRLRSDLLSKDPRAFFGFPVVRETMFVDDPRYIRHELRTLRKSQAWHSQWRPALRESPNVPAPACPYFPESSGNTIHHSFHLFHFEQATGANASLLTAILEFGGGYGGMCRLVHQLGFRGKYYIFDLPEFSALQEFYLRLNEIPVNDFNTDSSGVFCFSDFAQLQSLEEACCPSLFLATWSLSETPFRFRREVLAALRPQYWLIAYQHEFDSLDNSAFFADWAEGNPAWHWRSVLLEHLPGQQRYLIGARIET